MTEVLCHCGRALHYSNPVTRAAIERLIRLAGNPYVSVVGPDGRRWRVQRHYIALHGVRAEELPVLGFEEETP